jgi:GT2 family glycosyltransferase
MHDELSASTTVNVSVILPTYNREECLRNTLTDLVQQNPAPREIIVIDQSEQHAPATSALLSELSSREVIRYYRQPEPNLQRARNLGIMVARGEVLLFVDDDVRMEPDLVNAHWRNYAADPDLAAVCGFYVRPGEPYLDDLPARCKRQPTGWIYTPHSLTRRIECYSLPGCNGSVRREIAIQLGGFDENYTYTYLDDVDFSCRLKQLGVKAIHDPNAKLIHLKEPSGGKRPGGVDKYVVADSNSWYVWFYFFWSNFGWPSWRDLAGRFQRTILRRPTLLRPWSLLRALSHCLRGAWRARQAMRRGRQLGVVRAEAADFREQSG